MHQRWHYYTNQLPIIFHQVNNDKNQEKKCGIYLILNVYNQMYLFYIFFPLIFILTLWVMRDIKWYLSFDLQKLSWLCNAIQTPMKIFIIILVRWNVTLEQMEVRLSVLKYLSTVFTNYHILYQ